MNRKLLLDFALAGHDDGLMLVQEGNSYTLRSASHRPDENGWAVDPDDDGLGADTGSLFRLNLNIRDRVFRWILAGASDGWLLVQSGNSYELKEAEYRSDADAYVIEVDGEEQYYEDSAGMMGDLEGVPIGLVNDASRLIHDVETAKTATAADEKVTDRGQLSPDDELSLEEVQNSMKVGTVRSAEGPKHIVNPYHHADDEPDIVDTSSITRLQTGDMAPDTPRKAADNAIEAERATQGLNVGNLTDWVQIVGSFLMGAIVVEYISGSSGGGGVEVPLTLVFDYVLLVGSMFA